MCHANSNEQGLRQPPSASVSLRQPPAALEIDVISLPFS